MKVLASIISLFMLSGYCYIIYLYSKELFRTVFSPKNKAYSLLYCLGLLVPGLLFILLFNNERYIYCWDYAGYWVKAIQFSHSFFENPLQELNNVYYSIRSDEYNVFPNLLIAPVNRLLGLNYNLYIFANYLVYFVPFSLIASNLIIISSPGISNRLKWALPFFLLFFTPLLIPIRYGFVDIIGLVYIVMILSVFVKSNYLRQLTIKQSVLLGILLLLLIFSRRWYAFWFTAFFIAAFITNMLYAYRHKDRKAALNSTLNLTITGVTAMAVMLIFFMPFFKMTVLKNYKDIYSAYRSVSISRQIEYSIIFFSGYIVIMAFAGMFLSLKKEKSLTTFVLISTAIIIVHFTRVNDFGGHQHFYLLAPFLFILFCKALVYLDKNKFVLPVLFGLLLINNYFVFAKNNGSGNNGYVLSGIVAKRLDRPDYDALMALSNKAGQLIEQGSAVYCIASGNILNDDMVKNIHLPDVNHVIFKMMQTQHVDKRDRFPIELFMSNYVIVTTPAQLHLGADNQKLIYYFNQEILEGSIKSHYKKIQEFKLDQGVNALLMKKTTAFTDTEIQDMKDYFKTAYPDYPNMYETNDIVFKTSEIITGDGYAAVNFTDDHTVEISPGPTRASQITFQFDEKNTALNFTATFNNKESLAHDCNPERDGEVYLTILKDGIEIKKLYITHHQDMPVSLDITGGKKITLIVDKGKNEDYCDWFKLTDFIIK